MASVKLEGIGKSYGDQEVVSDLDLEVADGEFVCLVGPSGCGKSTTLRMVAGLEEITRGDVYIGDRRVNLVAPRDRNVAMVFQSYALFPHMTVEANIAFGLKIRKLPEEERRRKIQWSLELMGLESLAGRMPRELSGGERQRVALGRALVLEPEVLLLDEPLSNLDAGLRSDMRTALKKLHLEVQRTILYVTHDQVEAMTLSDRVAVMSRGRLMQVGTPREVYRRPRNLFVATFIGNPSMNTVQVRPRDTKDGIVLDAGDFQLPLGEVPAGLVLPYLNQPVILGMRPEKIQVLEKPADDSLRAFVNVVEPLGAENILDVNVGDTNFKIKVAAGSGIKPGQPIPVRFDRESQHLFDHETGTSLLDSLQRPV